MLSKNKPEKNRVYEIVPVERCPREILDRVYKKFGVIVDGQKEFEQRQVIRKNESTTTVLRKKIFPSDNSCPADEAQE